MGLFNQEAGILHLGKFFHTAFPLFPSLFLLFFLPGNFLVRGGIFRVYSLCFFSPSSYFPNLYFLFCFLSYFFDLVFHPFLLELSFYFNEIFIVSCPCFRDAILSHCSLRIFIRTGLVAVLEVFFCLLYYLCFSQIALFSFAFLLWFLSFRMKAFLICLVTFDCLCLKTD